MVLIPRLEAIEAEVRKEASRLGFGGNKTSVETTWLVKKGLNGIRKMVQVNERHRRKERSHQKFCDTTMVRWFTRNHPVLNDDAQLELSGIEEQPDSSTPGGDVS